MKIEGEQILPGSEFASGAGSLYGCGVSDAVVPVLVCAAIGVHVCVV